MKTSKSKTGIPKPTISRLPSYRRALQHLLAAGTSVVSSHDLASEADVTPSQLRKDLGYFGQFGTAGIGYDVRELLSTLEEILGTSRKRPVVLAGVGNLGRAVLNYSPLARAGFDIVASVDSSPRKFGRVIGGVRCYSEEQLEEIVKRHDIHIAILAVAPDSAQETAERLASAGVRAIVNFTQVRLRLPENVLVEPVDISLTLQKVAFYLDPMEGSK